MGAVALEMMNDAQIKTVGVTPNIDGPRTIDPVQRLVEACPVCDVSRSR